MNSKPNLYLDLDNTLISAIEMENYENLSSKKKKEIISLKKENMSDIFCIYQRPNLQKFLKFIFKNFNVSIWTAASKDYALFIYDKIIIPDSHKNDRKLQYLLFHYHGVCSKKRYGKKNPKQLQTLWDNYNLPNHNKHNTIILDDHPHVYNSQKLNCIIAEDFDIENPECEKDNFLNKCTKHLTNYLKEYNLNNGKVQNCNLFKFNKKVNDEIKDTPDYDDGEVKTCKKCKDTFITYSSKDKCPECR